VACWVHELWCCKVGVSNRDAAVVTAAVAGHWLSKILIYKIYNTNKQVNTKGGKYSPFCTFVKPTFALLSCCRKQPPITKKN
jgi:hypothetical protein